VGGEINGWVWWVPLGRVAGVGKRTRPGGSADGELPPEKVDVGKPLLWGLYDLPVPRTLHNVPSAG
jgi:hypothetical protein